MMFKYYFVLIFVLISESPNAMVIHPRDLSEILDSYLIDIHNLRELT